MLRKPLENRPQPEVCANVQSQTYMHVNGFWLNIPLDTDFITFIAPLACSTGASNSPAGPVDLTLDAILIQRGLLARNSVSGATVEVLQRSIYDYTASGLLYSTLFQMSQTLLPAAPTQLINHFFFLLGFNFRRPANSSAIWGTTDAYPYLR